jgi:hypothetical protein
LSRCDVSRILKTDDGGFVISGATSANQPLKSIVLLKIDSLGSSVWQRLYTTGGGERNNDIVDDETGYVICGSTGTSNGTDNLLLMKTDYSGNLLWQLAYGDSVSNIIGYSMIRNKNKFVIAAYADGYGAGESDFMLVKSDSVYDNSLCHMGMPQLLQDTVTLSDSLILGSASVVTTPSPGSFSVMPGVGETLICNFTLGVSKIEDNSIRMFPNPVNESGTITIELNKASELNMEIINVDGKKIFAFSDQSLAKKHIVHPDIFKSISSGIYFLKIITPESTFSSKFIFEGGN